VAETKCSSTLYSMCDWSSNRCWRIISQDLNIKLVICHFVINVNCLKNVSVSSHSRVIKIKDVKINVFAPIQSNVICTWPNFRYCCREAIDFIINEVMHINIIKHSWGQTYFCFDVFIYHYRRSNCNYWRSINCDCEINILIALIFWNFSF